MNLTAPERYRRMDESCGSMAEPQSRDELIKIPVGHKKKRKESPRAVAKGSQTESRAWLGSATTGRQPVEHSPSFGRSQPL